MFFSNSFDVDTGVYWLLFVSADINTIVKTQKIQLLLLVITWNEKIPIPIFRKVAIALDHFCEYENHNDILPTTKQIPYVCRVFKVFKQLEWIKSIFKKLIQMRQMKFETGVYNFVI